MRHTLRWAALLGIVLLALPTFADDAKKDDAKKGDAVPDTKKDLDKDKKAEVTSEKMIAAGQLIGKITSVEESKKIIRLRVTYEVGKINQGEANALAQAQANLLKAKNLQERINAQVEIAKHEANLITYEKKHQDVELHTAEDFKVRLPNPPVQFDEKGQVKKLTPKELKDLKGDSKLAGFPGEFSDLHNDQLVSVTLIKKKDAPRPKPAKGKDTDVDLLADHLPQVSVVLVISEPVGK
jgi:hypothetical protein